MSELKVLRSFLLGLLLCSSWGSVWAVPITYNILPYEELIDVQVANDPFTTSTRVSGYFTVGESMVKPYVEITEMPETLDDPDFYFSVQIGNETWDISNTDNYFLYYADDYLFALAMEKGDIYLDMQVGPMFFPYSVHYYNNVTGDTYYAAHYGFKVQLAEEITEPRSLALLFTGLLLLIVVMRNGSRQRKNNVANETISGVFGVGTIFCFDNCIKNGFKRCFSAPKRVD